MTEQQVWSSEADGAGSGTSSGGLSSWAFILLSLSFSLLSSELLEWGNLNFFDPVQKICGPLVLDTCGCRSPCWLERTPAHFVKHLTSDQQITFDKGFQVSPHFTYFPNTLMRQLLDFFFNNWINWLSYPSSLKIRKVYTSIGSLKFLFLFSCTTFSQEYIVSFICHALILLWFLHSKNDS